LHFLPGQNIALAQVRLASASNKPLLSAIYNYQFQKPYHWKDEWGKEWSAMLVLQFPIFSGFSTKGKVLQSRAQFKEVRYNLEDKNEEIELEVREIYLNLHQEEEMDAQLAVTQAKTDYLQALANYLIAKAKLIKAMGR